MSERTPDFGLAYKHDWPGPEDADNFRLTVDYGLPKFFATDPRGTSGLAYAWFGGVLGPGEDPCPPGSKALDPNTTNYFEVDSDGLVTSNLAGFTDGCIALAIVKTNDTEIIEIKDARSFINSGAKGGQCEKGEQGEQGPPGPPPEIEVGEVAMLPPGEEAWVDIYPASNLSGHYQLDFGIPQGKRGRMGQSLNIEGAYDSYGELVQNHPVGKPGQLFLVRTGEAAAPGQPGGGCVCGRFPIFENVQIYVSQANGNDEFGNHLGFPFKTIQAAIDYVYGYLDFKRSGLWVFINVGSGVYGRVVITGSLPAFLRIQNIDTPNDMGQTRINEFECMVNCYVELTNLTITNELSQTQRALLFVCWESQVYLRNVGFYVVRLVEYVVRAEQDSRIVVYDTKLNISTDGIVVNQFVFSACPHASIELSDVNISVLNTINIISSIGAFWAAQSLSNILFWNVTRTGNKCDKGSYRADCRSVIGSYHSSNDWGTGSNRTYNNGVIENWV